MLCAILLSISECVAELDVCRCCRRTMTARSVVRGRGFVLVAPSVRIYIERDRYVFSSILVRGEISRVPRNIDRN